MLYAGSSCCCASSEIMQIPDGSSSAQSSNTTTLSTPVSHKDMTCCALRMREVAVGEWWNNTHTVTTANVLTQFTQYEDTVAGKVSTLLNTSPTLPSIVDLELGIYGKFVTVNGTTTSPNQGGIMWV